jgi:uncharacterized protein YraI
MLTRTLFATAVLATLGFGAAEAATGFATGTVNMRTGPGTAYAKVTTIPAGAEVEVFECTSWCQVAFAGQEGWASARYISTDYAEGPSPRFVARAPMPPRGYWQYGEPWWDDRYDSWYDGHNWWYDGAWYPRPRVGVSFHFGGGYDYPYDRPRCWLPEGCW